MPKRASLRIKGLRAGASMLAAVALGACSNIYDETDLTQSRALVQWQDTSHQVPFAEGEARLTRDAQTSLDRFVEHQVGSGQQVSILIGQETDADRRGLQQRRASGLAAYFRARRVTVSNITQVPGTSYRNSAVVTTARLNVTTPDCPDWQRIRQGGTMLDGRHRFGCVTAAALGEMVADPADLLRGRSTGGADGAAMARGVQAYREGTLGQGQRRERFSVTEED